MTAEQQRDLAQRLKAALESAGIRVTKGVFQGGNLTRWTDVPPELLLGHWMRMAYRIEVDEQPAPVEQRTPLTLIKGEA